ncbi:hypothetical protein WK60_00280 [Burkholderia ubonensis]|uniref:hypothetical protein n=1 Tax=Burkholderia ubonensis TaxID=101571 RepID=UPI00075370ED|nr:hypothetical protein [Burkholderia ubonensis]KVT98527.1 hypothetical protein WK60_00280 [Burkholderia ubonensis]
MAKVAFVRGLNIRPVEFTAREKSTPVAAAGVTRPTLLDSFKATSAKHFEILGRAVAGLQGQAGSEITALLRAIQAAYAHVRGEAVATDNLVAVSATVSMALGGGTSAVTFSDLLKYGAPGLIVVILVISFGSLRSLQKAALEGGQVTADQIKPFVLLQCVYFAAAVLVFIIAVFAPKNPVNNAHRIAFTRGRP